MIMCSGPTGSGKTTTLYATLAEISRSELNVMTIEDPVEYVFPEVNQMQINLQADVTFASGLKSILRQDPDVILVGEIRDEETARIAVQSALTGHVVMSSLHATDATLGAVPPDRHGHRAVPDGVVARRGRRPATGPQDLSVVRRRRTSRPPEERRLYEFLGGTPKETFVHGVGCNYCSDTGYPRPGRRLRGARGHRRDPPADRDRGGTAGAARAGRRRRACARWATRRWPSSPSDVTTIDEVIRNVYVN